MWLRTQIKLYRTIRQYQKDKDFERILRADWTQDPDLKDFFGEIEERLQGEENKKLQQKQAEYLALQNQINPHFLYNTLEAIRADALLADCKEIAETAEALATFFRYTISDVQEYVTFSDELDNVENYFIIQRCRFGDKLAMELEMENEQLLEAEMPKLILQPLVENAIVHGLEDKIGRGTVQIIVENSNKVLFLRVRDDGVGISEEQVERLNEQFSKGERRASTPDHRQRKGGIALHNVNSRIRLMFGDDYGLRIYSAKGIGTECCVTLPLLFRED
ncbi:MAG: histidine kinase [Eubacteriales bacterium]|nr:histidine kinase [Eubacteriales bacterium]